MDVTSTVASEGKAPPKPEVKPHQLERLQSGKPPTANARGR